ncbi:type IV pilin protein [Synechococcus sp. BIOS-E4-1]|uniref:type IV pilin protein n=1 Tax=Synechococcus sp. BIOS-E4-1 TaxID=1400864 RepID=UPI0016493827|nr:type II secretion system protein [Synechococcus sp. BIOS-E4-1]
MNNFLKRSIAKRNQRQNGFTVLELMVTVSIVGILSSLAVPSFTGTLESSKSINAKQFVVDAAKDCSTAILYEHAKPTVTQADAGPDITLITHNCIEEGSVVADGGNDRWTVEIDADAIPEFPVKSAIPAT